MLWTFRQEKFFILLKEQKSKTLRFLPEKAAVLFSGGLLLLLNAMEVNRKIGSTPKDLVHWTHLTVIEMQKCIGCSAQVLENLNFL